MTLKFVHNPDTLTFPAINFIDRTLTIHLPAQKLAHISISILEEKSPFSREFIVLPLTLIFDKFIVIEIVLYTFATFLSILKTALIFAIFAYQFSLSKFYPVVEISY